MAGAAPADPGDVKKKRGRKKGPCKKRGGEQPPGIGGGKSRARPEPRPTVRGVSLGGEAGRFDLQGGVARMTHTRPGLQSTAEADDQGKITLTATGPAPKNEEGALEICARLVRALNATGGTWSAPVDWKQDIDGRSTNAAGNE